VSRDHLIGLRIDHDEWTLVGFIRFSVRRRHWRGHHERIQPDAKTMKKEDEAAPALIAAPRIRM
jgi:hypothetical protein